MHSSVSKNALAFRLPTATFEMPPEVTCFAKYPKHFRDFFSERSEDGQGANLKLYKEYDLVQQVHAAKFESTRCYDNHRNYFLRVAIRDA